MDIFSREKRANIMRGAKSKDTKPELAVRRFLHAYGYRYRANFKGLPGKPDLAFTKKKKAIFVHGCFWHQHDDRKCPISRRPSSNTEFWNAKFSRNRQRDAVNLEKLENAGWRILTVWECEVSNFDALSERLIEFLGSPKQR